MLIQYLIDIRKNIKIKLKLELILKKKSILRGITSTWHHKIIQSLLRILNL